MILINNKKNISSYYTCTGYPFFKDMLEYIKLNSNNNKIVYCGRKSSVTEDKSKIFLDYNNNDFYYDFNRHYWKFDKIDPIQKSFNTISNFEYIIIESK